MNVLQVLLPFIAGSVGQSDITAFEGNRYSVAVWRGGDVGQTSRFHDELNQALARSSFLMVAPPGTSSDFAIIIEGNVRPVSPIHFRYEIMLKHRSPQGRPIRRFAGTCRDRDMSPCAHEAVAKIENAVTRSIGSNQSGRER